MKLELKHLAPYLPYNLELVVQVYKSGRCQGTKKMETGSIETVLTMVNKNAENKACFPVLRPLSDLLDKEKDLWIDFSEEIDEIQTGYLIKAIVDKSFYSQDIHKSFKVREALFKMHFDVFGLIEQKLAIDINTLDYGKK